jgi:translation initiation factor IF-3
LSRPFFSRHSSSDSYVRVNGKIRAREVRVVGVDGKQLGVVSLNDALAMARQHGVDLVEVSATATPPVCRLVNLGKFRYEKAKKEKESKKHQHASMVKEIQLSPRIDPHDLGIKVIHAVDFLCEDMKVKVALKFRGREMHHTEIGFQVVNKFLAEIAAYGRPDFEAKLIGRGIHVMVSPLPRNKRAKNPHTPQASSGPSSPHKAEPGDGRRNDHDNASVPSGGEPVPKPPTKPSGEFTNSPFNGIDIRV